MSALPRHAWIDHPLAEALLRFDLLPSHYLHASRHDAWIPAAAQALANLDSLHRHVSGALLRRLGLGRVAALDDPALPLCMAPNDLFDHLVLACGLVLLGPALRRVIARGEVLALQAQLGEDGLRFARDARTWWDPPLEAGAPSLDGQDVREQAHRLGESLLAGAIAQATPPVARRGLLRLPASAPAALPPPVAAAPVALDLSLTILEALEPTWLSSFPAHR